MKARGSAGGGNPLVQCAAQGVAYTPLILDAVEVAREGRVVFGHRPAEVFFREWRFKGDDPGVLRLFDEPSQARDLSDEEVDAVRSEAPQGRARRIKCVDPDFFSVEVFSGVLFARPVTGISDADSGKMDSAGRAEAAEVRLANGGPESAPEIGAGEKDGFGAGRSTAPVPHEHVDVATLQGRHPFHGLQHHELNPASQGLAHLTGQGRFQSVDSGLGSKGQRRAMEGQAHAQSAGVGWGRPGLAHVAAARNEEGRDQGDNKSKGLLGQGERPFGGPYG